MKLLNDIFILIIGLFTSNPILAILGAFFWGILSVVLSPCHLSSIPLAIGFINGRGAMSHKRAFVLSFLFSIGILFSIAIIGVITGLLGRMLGDIGWMGIVLVGVVFILIGGWLLDFFYLPIPNIAQPHFHRKGFLTALLMGGVFGIAMGPCSFGFMMPLLAVVFQLSSSQFWLSVLLIFAFSLGHIMVIIFTGTFTNMIQKFLKWNSQSKSTLLLRKICGVLVGLSGVYLIFTVVGGFL